MNLNSKKMRKKTIITLITIITVIGVIITVRQNSKTVFNRTIGQVQKIMGEGMDEKKPVYLESHYLDTLFFEDNNDKILLFIPSNYSIEESQNTLNLIAEFVTELNNEKTFWILTNDKIIPSNRRFNSDYFTNYINIPGLTFNSEIGTENAFVFTLNNENRMSRVLWENEINKENVKNYLEKEEN